MVTKLNKSSYVQVTIISTIKMYSHTAVGTWLWFLRAEIRVSHSKLVNRIIKINYAHNLHVKMLDFAPFTDLYLKNANCSQD